MCHIIGISKCSNMIAHTCFIVEYAPCDVINIVVNNGIDIDYHGEPTTQLHMNVNTMMRTRENNIKHDMVVEPTNVVEILSSSTISSTSSVYSNSPTCMCTPYNSTLDQTQYDHNIALHGAMVLSSVCETTQLSTDIYMNPSCASSSPQIIYNYTPSYPSSSSLSEMSYNRNPDSCPTSSQVSFNSYNVLQESNMMRPKITSQRFLTHHDEQSTYIHEYMDPCNIDINNNNIMDPIFTEEFSSLVSDNIVLPCNYIINEVEGDVNNTNNIDIEDNTFPSTHHVSSSSTQDKSFRTPTHDANSFYRIDHDTHASSSEHIHVIKDTPPSFYKNLNDALMMDINSCFLPLLPLLNFHGHNHPYVDTSSSCFPEHEHQDYFRK